MSQIGVRHDESARRKPSQTIVKYVAIGYAICRDMSQLRIKFIAIVSFSRRWLSHIGNMLVTIM
ncbi:hypothetical protein COLO4_37137 [Corchorus olitorius]|uniref:Uncharacterized protein n=1 Tax=Corchorus olitorius TaxID=93759 RepID=A0A1R3G362_9ROSI|nr:hypothetical protein COLO4_37137 [Corchorus olitorius]